MRSTVPLVQSGSLALMLSVIGLTTAGAQGPYELFQQALVQERTYGNLERAVALYQQIVSEVDDDRALVATALVQLGSVQEKLDNAGARSAYRRVLRDFSDLRDPVGAARSRLAALSRSSAAPIDPTYTLVSDGIRLGSPGSPAPYDFSPDGRRLVYRDRVAGEPYPGLYVRAIEGNAARPLIVFDPVGGPTEGLWNPRWSPDGTRIAFTARFPGQDQVMGLYVMEVNGGTITRLGDSYESDLCWTNDGLAVTHIGSNQRLYTRVLTDRPGEAPLGGSPIPQNTILGGFSPDGALLALDISTERLGRELRDVWIMTADGGERIYVTDAPGLDAHPAWGADGSLYFVSDRGGSTNVWRLGADVITARRYPSSRMRSDPRPGRGWQQRAEAGLPGRAEQLTSFSGERVAYPRRAGGGMAFVLERAENMMRLAGAATAHESRGIGRGKNPQLASGGRIVFEGDQEGRGEIWVVSRDGGRRVRLVGDLAPHGRLSRRFDVSPNGDQVVYATDTNEGQTIFIVPVSGGTPRRVTSTTGTEPLYPVWSPDGTRIAFAGRRGIFVVQPDGGLPTRLAAPKTWDAWSVRWSPDGEYLAVLGWEKPPGPVEPRSHVYVVPSVGGELKRLTPDDERQDKEGLEWNPNGRELTYMYRAPDFEGDGLRTAYLDGRPTTQFIDEPTTWDYVGTWAPDGSAFYFLASDAIRSAWQLYRRDSRTGGIAEVATGANISLPSWSADGKTMVWSVERVTSQLWVMDVER